MEEKKVSRVRHYLNLDKTEGRLLTLLQDFSFAPIREVFLPIDQIYGQRLHSGSVTGESSFGYERTRYHAQLLVFIR